MPVTSGQQQPSWKPNPPMIVPPPPLLNSYSKTKTGQEQKDANELLDLRGFRLLPLGLEAQGHLQAYLELFTQGSSTSNTWGSR